MSVTRTVARNTFFQGAGRLFYLISSLIMIKLLTGYLGEAGFGQYSFIVDYLGFFGVLVDFGLYMISIQRINTTSDEQERKRILDNIFGLRLLSGLVAFAIACALIFLFPKSSSVKVGTVIASSSVLFFSLMQLLAGIFQGFHRAEFGALGEAASRLFVLIFVVGVMQLDLGFRGVMYSLVLGNGLGFLVAFFFVQKFVHLRLRAELHIWKKILKEALPLGMILAISYLYVRQATIILSVYPYMPAGITNDEAVGLYKAPFKLLEAVQGFPSLFLAALFPFLSKYVAERDARVNSMCQKAFDFLSGLAMPLLVGTLILADKIIPIITSGGVGWNRSISCLRILIVAVAFSFLSNFTGHIIIALKAQKKLIIPNIIYTVVNLVANITLIPVWAYNGSAVATVVTELVVVVVNFFIIKRLTGWSPSIHVLGKILFAAGCMGAIVFGLDRFGISFFFNVPVAIILYFIVLSWIGGLPDGMRVAEVITRFRQGRQML